ncbi:phosphotransferase system, EIIB family protein [Bacillus thuringiensis serovar morrisoni]|nr:phosphotransferase system, EIIB family protein [Bacillus thuringiensis serovar morrisoni]
MDEYRNMAIEILVALRGSTNVASYTNCMKRLRVTLIDYSAINVEALGKFNGVLGTVDDETYQIIPGPEIVTKVAEQFGLLLEVKRKKDTCEAPSAEEFKAKGIEMRAEQKRKNNTPFKNFCRKNGSDFIPLIPAFVGADLIAGIASILSNNIIAGNLDSTTWSQYVTILNIIKNAIFTYLVIYVGINAAKEFGATPALGHVIGEPLIYGVILPLGKPFITACIGGAVIGRLGQVVVIAIGPSGMALIPLIAGGMWMKYY